METKHLVWAVTVRGYVVAAFEHEVEARDYMSRGFRNHEVEVKHIEQTAAPAPQQAASEAAYSGPLATASNAPLFGMRPDGSVLVVSERHVECQGCNKASAIFVQRVDGVRCVSCDASRP